SVVGMADPDVEIRVNPGAGKDAGQLTNRRRATLGHRDRPQLRVNLEPAIEGAQEGTAAIGEMLPGVLAVEDDRDEGFSPAGSLGVTATGLDQPGNEILRGLFRRPARVHETDSVGEQVIAKRAWNGRAARTYQVRRVQLLGLFDDAARVARKV